MGPYDRGGRGGRGRGGGRGGGRGFGSFGGGPGGGRGGPRLPSALMQELGGGEGGGGGGGRFGRGFGRGGARGGGGGRGRGDGGFGRGRGGGGFGGAGGGGGGGFQGYSGGGGGAGTKRHAAGAAEAPRRHGEGGNAGRGGSEAKRPRLSGPPGPGAGGGGRGPGAAAVGLSRTLAAMQQRGGAAGGRGGGRDGGRGGRGGDRDGGGWDAPKTLFHELLAEGWEGRGGREAYLEELRLQARLAKRLGRSAKDALDGMDRLTGALSAAEGALLPAFLSRAEERAEAQELLGRAGAGVVAPGAAAPAGKGARKAAAAAAVKAKAAAAVPVPSSAAEAARAAAALLAAESDEELEALGIERGPGGARRVRAAGRGETFYGDSGSSGEGSEDGEDEEGSEEGEDEEGSDGWGELEGSSGSEGEGDEGEDEDEMDGSEGEDEEGFGLGYDGDSEDDGEDDEGEEEDEDEDGEADLLMGQLLGRGARGPLGSEEDEEGSEDEGEDSQGEGEDNEGGEGQALDGNDSDGDEGEEEDEEEEGAPQQAPAAPSATKYVPPALRAAAAAAAAAAGSSDPSRAALERRITGLINRLAEANLAPITRTVADLYGSEGRSAVAEAVATQILGAAASGPRASEQFCAVAAAFVAGLAAAAGAEELGAAFLAQWAVRLQAARREGDALAQTNLLLLLCHLYVAGLVGPGLVFGCLTALAEEDPAQASGPAPGPKAGAAAKEAEGGAGAGAGAASGAGGPMLTEAGVSGIVTVLNAVGLSLRSADPAAMRDFVLRLHGRAAEAGKQGGLSRRASLMLDLVVDIKNNRASEAGGRAAQEPVLAAAAGGKGSKRAAKAAAAQAAAGGAGGGGRRGGALAALPGSASQWLAGLGVGEVALRGLTWAALNQPRKKGFWWQPAPGSAAAAAAMSSEPLLAAASAGGRSGAGVASAAATAALLQAAAALRMNTDVRRAVFVAIMGSEDCADAHEKLMRLPLQGDQRREIIVVLVECCLAEKAWNPYYAHLALRLCGAGQAGAAAGAAGGGGGSLGRAHRLTLQYCLWDRFKELQDMEVRPLTHLMRLAAVLVARFALGLSLLKVVSWSALGPKEVLAWRLFLQHLLQEAATAGDVQQLFKRLAQQPKTLGPLSRGLLGFLRSSFAPWAAARLPPGPASDELLRRTRSAERELAAGMAAAQAAVVGVDVDM